MQQSIRIDIAKNTLEILEQGFYINPSGKKIDVQNTLEKAVSNTKLYSPEKLDELSGTISEAISYPTTFEVTNETTLDAVRRLVAEGATNTLCLNFASAKNPGGGFLGGALAQEECIARASGLYPCLLTAKGYYDYHRSLRTCLYSDHMIYSPEVPVLKDEEGNLLDELVVTGIITSPAVNAGVVKRQEPANVNRIIPAMEVRIEKLLALCLHYRHNTLVLGAWGCGVFQNNPDDIAELFRKALTGRFANRFKRVVFAIKTNKESIIEPFRNRF